MSRDESSITTPRRQARGRFRERDAAPAADAQDSELRRLAAAFLRHHARYSALASARPVEVNEQRKFARFNNALAERVAALPAATIYGMRVKASVWLSYANYGDDGRLELGSHDELLAWSIARDLLGEAVASAAPVKAAEPATPADVASSRLRPAGGGRRGGRCSVTRRLVEQPGEPTPKH